MFPKAIVFLVAVVVAEEVITNRVKREEFDEEDDVDTGLAVNARATEDEYLYRNCCICCEDVHCITFDGLPIRLKGICPANLMAANLSYEVEVEIATVGMSGVSRGNRIGNVNITYKGVSYIIDRDCNVRINGELLQLTYETTDVIIWRDENKNKVYWKIKGVDFVVSRDCEERCVEVCAGEDFAYKMEGICANYNHNPADDMLGYPRNLLGYWQYSRHWYQLAHCLPQGVYP